MGSVGRMLPPLSLFIYLVSICVSVNFHGSWDATCCILLSGISRFSTSCYVDPAVLCNSCWVGLFAHEGVTILSEVEKGGCC